ncbi:MAG: PaaX family transcriptional regulator [Solirubrobacteraceae bacterium]
MPPYGFEREPVEADTPQRLLAMLMHDYARGASALAWSGGLVQLMCELGFSGPAARMALSRLARSGAVERVRQGRFVHYSLSQGERRRLELQDRRLAAVSAESRLHAWTVAWHRGPQDTRHERTRLTRMLRPLGFATLHAGVWIAPGDRRAELVDLLGGSQLAAHLSAIAGEPAQGSLAPLPEWIWSSARLERGYRQFAEQWAPIAARREPASDPAEAFALRVRLTAELRAIVAEDPGLPLDADDGRDARAQALALFHELAERLSQPARRHFDHACTAWMRRPLPAEQAPPARCEPASTARQPSR